MPRILISTDAVGGVWRYSMELAGALAACGWQTELAVLGPPASAVQRDEAAAIPGLHMHDTGLSLDWTAADLDALRDAAIDLARLSCETRVDRVHLHAPALAAVGDWAAPVVAVAHSCVATWWRSLRTGPLPPDLAWRAELTGQGLRRADRVITPTRAFADLLRDTYRIATPITVVHNGRTSLPQPRVVRSPSVFTAGRLWDEGKNVAMLDRLAAQLPCPVLAAGSRCGPQGGEIALRHIQPLGSLDEADLARNYAAASLFVSLARYEPFGLAVLEAAQSGLPLLLSDIPVFRELWDGAAIFVNTTDDDAALAALHDLLDDPADWGLRARQRARRYTPAAMAQATLACHAAAMPRVAAA